MCEPLHTSPAIYLPRRRTPQIGPTSGLAEILRRENGIVGVIERGDLEKRSPTLEGPRVRIHLPPAESLSLGRIHFRRSRTPAFRAGVRGWLGDWVGRDALAFAPAEAIAAELRTASPPDLAMLVAAGCHGQALEW